MKILSWNVNGLRSHIVDFTTSKNKKIRQITDDSPLHQIITLHKPDIICFQETRLGPDLYSLFDSDSINTHFPHRYWSSSTKTGARSGNRYSGTSIWSKKPAKKELYTLPGFVNEGRFIQLEFDKYILINTYTPNTGSNWEYRLDIWEPAIKKHIRSLSNTKSLIYCGDFNVATKRDVWFGDLLEKRLKTMVKDNPDSKDTKKLKAKVKSKSKLHSGEVKLCGYTQEEQSAFNSLLNTNKLIDTFHFKNPKTVDQFSWFNARIKGSFNNNIGWLIDRFLVREKDKGKIKDSRILSVIGTYQDGKFISDHLPILLDIKITF